MYVNLDIDNERERGRERESETRERERERERRERGVRREGKGIHRHACGLICVMLIHSFYRDIPFRQEAGIHRGGLQSVGIHRTVVRPSSGIHGTVTR